MTHTCLVHGRPDASGVPMHHFSTNSNAFGPFPPALAAVNPCDASRYPDAYTALKGGLIALHSVARLEASAQPSAQARLTGSLGQTCLPSEASFFCALRVGNDPEAGVQTLRHCGTKWRDTASPGLTRQVRLEVLSPVARNALRDDWPVSDGAALPTHTGALTHQIRALT
jgi:hypothetical protein